MKGERVSPLPKSRAAVYLRKAEEFGRNMDVAMSGGSFNAAGLSGIHAVISACDAITVARLGVRSTAPVHSQVLKLLIRCDVPSPFLTQVRETLALKNRVEHEAIPLTRPEVEKLQLRVRRVLELVEKVVGTA